MSSSKGSPVPVWSMSWGRPARQMSALKIFSPDCSHRLLQQANCSRRLPARCDADTESGRRPSMLSPLSPLRQSAASNLGARPVWRPTIRWVETARTADETDKRWRLTGTPCQIRRAHHSRESDIATAGPPYPATSSSASPESARRSSVAGWKVDARISLGTAGSRSSTVTVWPRSMSHQASVSPEGPAPTIVTGALLMSVVCHGADGLVAAWAGVVAEGPCYIAVQPQNRRWASQMDEGYYGRNGTLGLATPQANPTAETEFRALLPEGVGCATVRMASEEPDPEARLRAYFIDIAETLNRFDTLAMRAVGLACTGSSYLLGHDAVEANLAELSAHREQPIVSAASAIERALAYLGARSIALICPYPQWLLDAADAHWQSRGFEVVDQVSLDPGQGDTRAIYGLSPRDAAERITSRWQTRKRRLPHYRHRSANPARRRRIVWHAAGPRLVLESVSGLGDPANSGHRSRRAGPDVSDAALGGLGASHRSTLMSRLLQ